jgi:molecular chaperone DnaJ
MNVRIPAGVETGVRLRLSGEGEAGFDGGPPGDLYVVLHVREHPLFQREGPDLRCELPISIAQAALGCDVEVPTLEGKQTITVHPGTQSGETLRLREKGLPRLGGGPAGDQYVEIFVEIPTRLSSEQRELLERFAEVSGDDVSPRRRGFVARCVRSRARSVFACGGAAARAEGSRARLPSRLRSRWPKLR